MLHDCIGNWETLFILKYPLTFIFIEIFTKLLSASKYVWFLVMENAFPIFWNSPSYVILKNYKL
jgi:hypothetical protein